MEIRVRLFGSMKQYAPEEGASFSMVLDKTSKVSDALNVLRIPQAKEKTILLNGRRVDAKHPMEDGALMVIFPHIEGG
jgi:molybdopterin converting factor small subunit